MQFFVTRPYTGAAEVSVLLDSEFLLFCSLRPVCIAHPWHSGVHYSPPSGELDYLHELLHKVHGCFFFKSWPPLVVRQDCAAVNSVMLRGELRNTLLQATWQPLRKWACVMVFVFMSATALSTLWPLFLVGKLVAQ